MCHGSTGRHFGITERHFVALTINSNEMLQGVAMVNFNCSSSPANALDFPGRRFSGGLSYLTHPELTSCELLQLASTWGCFRTGRRRYFSLPEFWRYVPIGIDEGSMLRLITIGTPPVCSFTIHWANAESR